MGLIPEQSHLLSKQDSPLSVRRTVTHTLVREALKHRSKAPGAVLGRGGSAGATPEEGQQTWSPGLPGEFR